MVKLEAQEWYYGMLSPEDLATYLTQTGDFLVRCWDAGNGLSLYLSCKFEKISTATATGTTMTTKENVTQNEENEEAELQDGGCKIRHYVLSFVENKDTIGWTLSDDKDNKFDDVVELIRFYHFHDLPGGGKLVRGSTRPNWQLKHAQVSKKEKLGAGNFCAVYRGVIRSSGEEVAIKICLDNEFKAMESLIDEARIMARIDHPNIIKFIGFCCDSPPVMILMELCVLALLDHLTKRGPQITAGEKLLYAIDVSEGMTYLQSKNLVHRDLGWLSLVTMLVTPDVYCEFSASRNCLFNKRGICKVADFGLSKFMTKLFAEKIGTIQVPLRWMAPETLHSKAEFSPKSDVWSFGVLVFEIFTNGDKPFNSDDWPLKKIATYIRKGKMVDPPAQAPSEVQELMKCCWKFLPEERINFDAICSTLKEIQVKIPAPDRSELILTQVPGILSPEELAQNPVELCVVKKVMVNQMKKKKKQESNARRTQIAKPHPAVSPPSQSQPTDCVVVVVDNPSNRRRRPAPPQKATHKHEDDSSSSEAPKKRPIQRIKPPPPKERKRTSSSHRKR